MKYAPLIASAITLILVSCRVGAQETDSIQKILQSRSAAIVSLRIVSKLEMSAAGQSQSRELRTEVQGVLVDKDGLIMASTLFINPYSANMNESAAGVKMTPTSIKVLFGGDDKEYTAFLAATDTKLNLSFIQIEDLAGKSVEAVQITGGATPVVGERLVSVSRMSRGYDYSVFYQTGQINGEIARPRHAWMVTGGISGFGLPVFTLNNELVGILTTIPSTIKEDSQNPDTMGMQMAMRMMTGGGMLQPFLVPASMIDGLIVQAKTKAVELAAKRKAGKADPEKPEVPKKPTTTKPAPKK